MKKNFIFMILVFFFALTSISINRSVYADGNGSLQLDPSVITDSGVKSGGSDDFPIKSELFLPAISGYAKNQEATRKEIPQKIETINFGGIKQSSSDLLYSTKELFQNYKPTILTTTTSQRKADSQTNIWLFVIIFIGIIFMIFAFVFGRRNAKRSRRKRYEKSH
ncbi:MAG: type VII secretion protein EssA [Streptococcaceae bacterium]|jgi:type VII secretion protein EssA|nr:type VII secretion protein EssA [Streptococcaceae bacterium]